MNYRLRLNIVCCLLFLFCQSCENLVESTLFVGQPSTSSVKKIEVRDGLGQEARFGLISQMVMDSTGNLYVFDAGENRNINSENIIIHSAIRKITPEGVVSTIFGSGSDYKEELIGFSPIYIHSDYLYFTSAGCMLKMNLKAEIPEPEKIYGDCLSLSAVTQILNSEEAVSSNSELDLFWDAFINYVDLDKNIYLSVRLWPHNKDLKLKIYPNDRVENLQGDIVFPSGKGLRDLHTYDSQGRAYFILEGSPGPGTPGPDLLVRIPHLPNTQAIQDFSFDDKTYLFEDKINHPHRIAIDDQDNIYILEGNIYKYIDSNGYVQNIAEIDFAVEFSTILKNQLIDSSRNLLYFATPTAIYKIPLPE